MRLLWGFLLLSAGSACLTGCPKSLPMDIPGVSGNRMSDEEQISLLLDDVQTGMESGKIYKILAHVSQSYHDEEGRDFEAIRNYLSEILRAYRDIKVTRAPPRIVVQGDRARAMETFGTVAEPLNTAEYPPINLQGQVPVYLERVNGKWYVTEWGTLR
jgi:hypothetical protein